ncbi:MAG: hypothetical protein IPO78_17270 [Saprospiraceae bacterium]|nr:hypothetical protein [Saprospiraceae bacterium]
MKNLDIQITKLTLDEQKNLDSLIAMSTAIKTLIETYKIINSEQNSELDFITYTETISAMAQRTYNNSISN